MADLDFVENAAIWTFAGLLAISASPLAAIAFLTVAPQFVIAVRTGNLGGIVTMYVDGIPAAVVDTYSDPVGTVEKILFGDPELDEHQIYVQKDDNPDTIIEVIRKKLSADEVQPPGTRWNEDCDCVQQTPDGGTTWNDAPGLDPRSAPGFRLPPTTVTDPQCNAAANMVAKLRTFVNFDLASASQWSLASELLGAVLLFVPGVNAIVDAFLIVAGIITTIGSSAIDGAFTEDVYDQFLCIFYFNIDADGQMSDDQLAAIYSAVAEQFDSVVQAVFGAHSSYNMGPVGWSNAGVRGESTDADCAACTTWCHEFDFTLGNELGFSPVVAEDDELAVWTGAGWTSIYNRNGDEVTETRIVNAAWGVSANITNMSFDRTTTIDGTDFNFFAETTGGLELEATGEVSGTGSQTVEAEFSAVDALGCRVDSGVAGSGTIVITKVRVYGTGENPFGEDNC